MGKREPRKLFCIVMVYTVSWKRRCFGLLYDISTNFIFLWTIWSHYKVQCENIRPISRLAVFVWHHAVRNKRPILSAMQALSSTISLCRNDPVTRSFCNNLYTLPTYIRSSGLPEYCRLPKTIRLGKEAYSSLCYKHHTATGTHVPYGITQCYLPPSRGDIPAFTPAN